MAKSFTILSILLLVGGRMVMHGDLTIGMLVAFQMFASRISQPMLRMVGLWQQWQQTLEDADLGEVVGIRTPQVVSEVLGGRRPPRPVIIWVSQSGHGSGHGAAWSRGPGRQALVSR